MKRPIEKCRKCNTEMILDDIDYNFEGNEDRYYLCPKCHSYLIVKVRYRKIIRKTFITNRGEE